MQLVSSACVNSRNVERISLNCMFWNITTIFLYVASSVTIVIIYINMYVRFCTRLELNLFKFCIPGDWPVPKDLWYPERLGMGRWLLRGCSGYTAHRSSLVNSADSMFQCLVTLYDTYKFVGYSCGVVGDLGEFWDPTEIPPLKECKVRRGPLTGALRQMPPWHRYGLFP
jgi:hypothetical protein